MATEIIKAVCPHDCPDTCGMVVSVDPATGRAVAELIVHGKFVSLDLTIFGYERVVVRRPVKELNVI